jgi:chemotaxis protein CheD
MKKVIVSIGEMKLSNQLDEVLITYALGSCLGIAIYDPFAKVGGLLHIMLPDSNIVRNPSEMNPCKFVDTAIPILFKEAYKIGAQKKMLQVYLAGCSQIGDAGQFFNIGKRNYAAARKLLWKNNIFIKAEHCGANYSRTLSLYMNSGKVTIKMGSEELIL